MNRRGMSLPELLVAMACATLVAWMAFDLLKDEQGHYTRTRGKVRVQADVREAMRVVEDDFLNAGYRSGVATSGVINAIAATAKAPQTVTCVLDPTLSPAIQVTDGTASDILMFQYYAQQTVAATVAPYPDCTKRIQTTYQVDVDSNLVRQYVIWTAGVAGTPTTSIILPHVVTFQAQIGTDSSTDLANPTTNDVVYQKVSDALVRGTASGFTASDITAGRSYDFTGWTSGTAATLNGAPVSLAANATYRVTASLVPSQEFINWMDTTNRANNFIRMGFVDPSSGNWVDSVGVRSLPLSGQPTQMSWIVRTSAAKSLKFHFEAKLTPASALTSTPTLTLQGLSMTRIRNASQDPLLSASPNWVWHNGDSGALGLRRTTRAVRLWIVAKSARTNKEGDQRKFDQIGNWDSIGTTPKDQNTYVLQERVIPVVNP